MTLNDLMEVSIKAKILKFRGMQLRIQDVSLSTCVIGRSMKEDYEQTLVNMTLDICDMPYATIEIDHCPAEIFVRDWLSEMSVAE